MNGMTLRSAQHAGPADTTATMPRFQGGVFQRWMRRLLLLVALFALPSCQKSPQESLVGRWYNPDMSIRFREDGSVLFSSRAGRGVGRYVFDGSERKLTSTQVPRNVIMDVLMNNERVRLEFQFEFLSQDRMQLHGLLVRRGGTPALELNRKGVLKRDLTQSPT
jgi:hypothetical protein